MNVVDAQKTRNQYVWVPVPDVTKIYGIDADGKMWGKLYEFTVSESTEVDKITGAKPLNWTENNGIINVIDGINHREPDVVTNNNNDVYDMDSRLTSLNIGEEATHDWLSRLEMDFNQMIKSISEYGGFYVGRYETGNLSQNTAVVQKGNTDIASQAWYTMYEKCKTLKGNNNNIETDMIWGCQFDRTLAWLVESKNKTKSDICEDSISWGNYINNSIAYIGSDGTERMTKANVREKIPTGSSEVTKANNIYDLAGNVLDWTKEVYGTDFRVRRGGFFINNSMDNSVSRRYNSYYYPNIFDNGIGCRAMLYIK